MRRSGLAQFLYDTDNLFKEREKETNALISEMTKQRMFPSFNSKVVEHITYGIRPEKPVLKDEYKSRNE